MSTPEPEQDAVNQRDREGNPLTLAQWSEHFADPDYRLVGETQHGDILVRTLWEGLDDGVQVACQYHTGINLAGAWTTVWNGYWPCTEAQAKASHEAAVAVVREACPATAAEHQPQVHLRTIERRILERLEKAASELEHQARLTPGTGN
ncbi:hypothetical protein [Streptomyces sp. Midd1]|uniref:hypothetical protein n=1 Tax=Streptomyces sp. Midd3 TaxID=3161191 RepID=UPI0034DAE49A